MKKTNKLFTKLSTVVVSLAMALGVGVAAASNGGFVKASAAEEIIYTLNPVAGSDNGYATNEDIECGGVVWNVTGNATMIPWRIGGKSLSNTDRVIYSQAAVTSQDVTKVVLTVGTATNVTVNSLKLIVSSAANGGGTKIDEISKTFAASSDITFNRPDGHDWAGRYFSFVFNLTIGKDNKYVQFTKADFYYETGEPAKYTVTYSGNGADTGDDPEGESNLLDGETHSVVEIPEYTKEGYDLGDKWNTKADGSGESYAHGDTLTIDGASVVLYAQWTKHVYPIPDAGSITITGDDFIDTYDGGATKNHESTITANPATQAVVTWESVNVMKSGGAQFKANGGTIYNTVSLGCILSIDITYSGANDNKLDVYYGKTQNDGCTSTSIGTDNGFFRIVKNGNGAAYATSIVVTWGAPATLNSVSAVLDDAAKVKEWRVGDELKTTDIDLTTSYSDENLNSTISDGTGVYFNSGHTATTYTFAQAGTNSVNVYYIDEAERTASTTIEVTNVLPPKEVVAWSIEGSVGDTYIEQDYDLSLLTLNAWYDQGKTDKAPANVASQYVLVANPATAGLAEDPNNTITVEVYLSSDSEHTNLKASFADISAPIVNAEKGTHVANPYSVSDAFAAIDASAGVTSVYTKGIVSKIVTAYNSQYGNITFDISADGTTTGSQLRCYRTSGSQSCALDANTINVGDEVVVCGNLILYEDTTYEYESGNQLVRHVAETKAINLSLAIDTLDKGSTFVYNGQVSTAFTVRQNVNNIPHNDENLHFSEVDMNELGNHIVTVTYHDELFGDLSKSYTLVIKYADVNSVTLNTKEAKIGIGEGKGTTFTATLNANTDPETVIEWSSSDNNVASVSNGAVLGVAEGTAIITASVTVGNEKIQDTCTIHVSGNPLVELDRDEVKTARTGENYELTATAHNFGDDVTVNFAWETSDPTIATVTQDTTNLNKATVNCKAEGAVSITVTATHGNDSATDDCEFTIAKSTADLSDITSSDGNKLYLGSAKMSLTLSTTVTVHGVAEETVEWSSSDENIATIDSKGVVTANAKGTATMTATSSTGDTKTFDVEVKAPTSINILSKPTKLSYEIGEQFSFEGLDVEVVYDDETKLEAFVYSVSEPDMNVEGKQEVEVSSFGAKAKFEINISKLDYFKQLTNISELKSGDQILVVATAKNVAMGDISDKYCVTENVNIVDQKGIAKDNNTEAIALTVVKNGNGWSLQNADGKYLNGKVNGTNREMSWSDNPVQVFITLNEDNNAVISFGKTTDDKDIKILYNVGSPRFSVYSSEPAANMLLPQIYVVHGSGETPEIKTLTDIELSGQYKTTYNVGEEFDKTNLVVTAKYSDGSSKAVTNYTISGFNKDTAGEQTVTVSYEEGGVTKTAEFKVTVNGTQPSEKTLLGIDVTANPTKTTYEVGETFDPAGLEVTAKYSDQSSEKVTNYSLSQVDMSTAGTKTITVTYEGKTAEFTITVNDSTQPGEDVPAAKASAIELLRQHMLDLLNSGEYDTDGAAKLGQEYDKGIAAINSATTVAEVNAAYAAARAALDAVEKQSGGETDPLAQAKADAIADMEAYVTAKGQDNYSETNWASIQTILNTAKESINSCTTANDIRDTVTGAKLLVDAVKTAAQEAEEAAAAALAKAKTDAIAELEAYVAAKGQDNYSETNWATIQTVLNAAKDSINNCTSIEDVQTTVSGAKAFIDLAKTIDQEVEEAKEAAIAELEALVNGLNRADYSDEAWAELQDTLADARAAINRATDATALNNLVAAWKAAIGDVTADIKTAKEAAIAALDIYYNSFNKDNYDEAGQSALRAALDNGKVNIEAATNVDAVAAALANAKAEMDRVETKPSAPAKRCGGDIAATSIILSALALAGAGLLVFKKRKQD